MDRRLFLTSGFTGAAVVVAPAAAVELLPGMLDHPTRLSLDKSDPGRIAWDRLNPVCPLDVSTKEWARRYPFPFANILLDGVEQRYVVTADEEMGFVKRGRTDANGELVVVYAFAGRGGCVMEKRKGRFIEAENRYELITDQHITNVWLDETHVAEEVVWGKVQIVYRWEV